MHGNVAEWCRDDYAPYPYALAAASGANLADREVVRGGSWPDTMRMATFVSWWR
jgi:formylglycine-generating enzyme required for sulfatase activity